MTEITLEEVKWYFASLVQKHDRARHDMSDPLQFGEERRVDDRKYAEIQYATYHLALAALLQGERDREDARRYRALRDWPGLSVSLERDAHTVNRETAAQAIEWSPEAFHETPEQLEAMRDANTIWRLQWYPETPVGFHAFNRATLDALVDDAHASLREGKET